MFRNNSNRRKQIILLMILNREKREAIFDGSKAKSKGQRQ